jgi:hypothetical protein
MTYRTGHRPDPPIVVARRTGLHLHPEFRAVMGRASALPMATHNRAWMPVEKGGPGILDQHDTGSCEGHAHASGATLLLASKGQSQGLISPTALYLGALLVDQVLAPDGTLSVVTDTGTMPSSVQSAWQTFGARLAKDDPQVPANSATLYADPSNPNSPLVLPTVEQLYADSPYRFGGAYFITAQGPARLLQALAALASGKTITDALAASGPEFQGYTGGIVGALPGPIDHANLIVDHEWMGSALDWQGFTTALQQGNAAQVTALSANLIFHCVNSWGSWGEEDSIAQTLVGMYRANIEYFNQVEDLCVLDLSATS